MIKNYMEMARVYFLVNPLYESKELLNGAG